MHCMPPSLGKGLLQPARMFDKECSGVGRVETWAAGSNTEKAGWITLPDGCILSVQRSFGVFYALIKWFYCLSVRQGLVESRSDVAAALCMHVVHCMHSEVGILNPLQCMLHIAYCMATCYTHACHSC